MDKLKLFAKIEEENYTKVTITRRKNDIVCQNLRKLFCQHNLLEYSYLTVYQTNK